MSVQSILPGVEKSYLRIGGEVVFSIVTAALAAGVAASFFSGVSFAGGALFGGISVGAKLLLQKSHLYSDRDDKFMRSAAFITINVGIMSLFPHAGIPLGSLYSKSTLLLASDLVHKLSDLGFAYSS